MASNIYDYGLKCDRYSYSYTLQLVSGTEDTSGPPAYNVVVTDEQKQAPGTQPVGQPPVQPQLYPPQGGYPMQYVGQQPIVQPVPGYVYPQQPVIQGGFPVQQVQYAVSEGYNNC